MRRTRPPEVDLSRHNRAIAVRHFRQNLRVIHLPIIVAEMLLYLLFIAAAPRAVDVKPFTTTLLHLATANPAGHVQVVGSLIEFFPRQVGSVLSVYAALALASFLAWCVIVTGGIHFVPLLIDMPAQRLLVQRASLRRMLVDADQGTVPTILDRYRRFTPWLLCTFAGLAALLYKYAGDNYFRAAGGLAPAGILALGALVVAVDVRSGRLAKLAATIRQSRVPRSARLRLLGYRLCGIVGVIAVWCMILLSLRGGIWLVNTALIPRVDHRIDALLRQSTTDLAASGVDREMAGRVLKESLAPYRVARHEFRSDLDTIDEVLAAYTLPTALSFAVIPLLVYIALPLYEWDTARPLAVLGGSVITAIAVSALSDAYFAPHTGRDGIIVRLALYVVVFVALLFADALWRRLAGARRDVTK